LVSYAITVHKSQGITLDKVVCDISAPEFAASLSYVAVSRVKTLGGLMFENPFDRNRVYRESPSSAMRLKLADHAIRLLQELEDVKDDDLSEKSGYTVSSEGDDSGNESS
jgi:ATP-dependent exoDNAse (exonuclease V) alpha subunit